jgi:ATP-dependent Lon protease
MASDEASKPKISVVSEPDRVVRPGDTLDVPMLDGGPPIPDTAAVMAIRNIVVFPGTVMPLTVGREKSRRLIDEVLPQQKVIVLAAQRDPRTEDPAPSDLYDYASAVVVLKLLRGEDGNQTVIVHGLSRVHVEEYVQTAPYLRAKIAVLKDETPPGTEMEARLMDVRAKALRIVQLSPNVPDEAQMVINSIDAPGALTDFLAANLPLEMPIKQELLAETNVLRRLELLQSHLHRQVEVLELSGQIQEQVRASIDKNQREYFLREQLKAIKKELGQFDDQAGEADDLKKKVEAAGMGDAVKAECLRELGRLEAIPAASPEYTVIRTYLDVMTELPWSKATPDNLDIVRAGKVLDEDHYDLEKVKKRILEYLAVRKLAPESHGPILCFLGPPGVGKTSLGQSIARALGRKFIRMSLGGMHDEAELRGHRRTYIGAMPGRIIQELRKAGSNNPVFMLDELDKVGSDFRGDPSSALLEILDPAQNFSFQDHYLNVPFDLSKVLFIGTANIMQTVPAALRDRMEVIDLAGYTTTEKLHIAVRYLLPRQIKENGLQPGQLRMDEEALRHVALRYTREAGVRELERRIGAVCRGVAAGVAAGKIRHRSVSARNLAEFLGPPEYESEAAQRTSVPGVATGLAYTAYGGEIMFIEATAYPGKGNMVLTGHIGDVMRESAQAALSLIRSRADKWGIDSARFTKLDIHVHVPAGAVPKDGPSAGVTIATALCSLLCDSPIRSDVAMTGEITLRGLVLPVGGIKEKMLAALQSGIKTVILPARNKRHLEELPPEVRKKMKFVFANTIDDVLAAALTGGRPHREKAPPAEKAPKAAKPAEKAKAPGKVKPKSKPSGKGKVRSA